MLKGHIAVSAAVFPNGTKGTARSLFFKTQSIIVGLTTPAVRQCCAVLASPLSTLTRDHLKCIILKTPCVLPSGHLLDSFARAALWDSGLDYLHGTGHGVGCFLNVHEGPCGISYKTFADEPLEAGMIVSDGTSLSAGGCSDTMRVPLRCVSHMPRRVRHQHVVTETV